MEGAPRRVTPAPGGLHRSTPYRGSAISEERLLGLVELAYDAASDRARWTDLLQAPADDLRCELVALDLQDRQAQSATVQCHVGPNDPALQREYETYQIAKR